MAGFKRVGPYGQQPWGLSGGITVYIAVALSIIPAFIGSRELMGLSEAAKSEQGASWATTVCWMTGAVTGLWQCATALKLLKFEQSSLRSVIRTLWAAPLTYIVVTQVLKEVPGVPHPWPFDAGSGVMHLLMNLPFLAYFLTSLRVKNTYAFKPAPGQALMSDDERAKIEAELDADDGWPIDKKPDAPEPPVAPPKTAGSGATSLGLSTSTAHAQAAAVGGTAQTEHTAQLALELERVLRDLNSLYERGLITKEDLDRKRRELLSRL